MKQGKPLKRTTGLKQGDGLKKGGIGLGNGFKRNRARLKQTKSKPDGSTPEQRANFRRTAMARSNGLSVVSGEPADEVHHVIEKELLRTAGFIEDRWNPDNGIAVTETEHGNHTSRFRTIPYDALPACAIEFAEKRGFAAYLKKHYS